MSPLLILAGLLVVAAGLAHDKDSDDEQPGNEGKSDDAKADQLGPRRPGRGGDREPGSGGGDDHGKRGLNEPARVEPANVGNRDSGQSRDDRGCEPDPAPGDHQAEPVTPEPAPEPEPEPEPEPAQKATPKKRAKKTAEKPAETEEETE